MHVPASKGKQNKRLAPFREADPFLGGRGPLSSGDSDQGPLAFPCSQEPCLHEKGPAPPTLRGPDSQSCKESGLRSHACCWQPGSRVHCVEGASWSPVPVWGTQLVLALNPCMEPLSWEVPFFRALKLHTDGSLGLLPSTAPCAVSSSAFTTVGNYILCAQFPAPHTPSTPFPPLCLFISSSRGGAASYPCPRLTQSVY